MKTVNLFTSVIWAQLACAIAQPGSLEECTAAEYKRLLFEVGMDTFEEALAAYAPPCFDWDSDGCSGVPDAPAGHNFLRSCTRHDFGYRNHKYLNVEDASGMRERVDEQFLEDMYETECGSNQDCRNWAGTYKNGVSKYGSKAWTDWLCYSSGASWENQKDDARRFVDKFCLSAAKSFQAKQTESSCHDFDSSGRSVEVEIHNTSPDVRVLRRQDCVAGLMKFVDRCDQGGKASYFPWQFRVDPNDSSCD